MVRPVRAREGRHPCTKTRRIASEGSLRPSPRCAITEHALQANRDAIDLEEIAVRDSRGEYYARAEQLSPVEGAAFEEAVDRILRFLGSAAGKRYLQSIAQEGPAA
jgi:hypothetical protein